MERIDRGRGARWIEGAMRPDFLAGFALPEGQEQLAAVKDKIARFIQAGPSQIKTVWDFDRTITWGTYNGRDATVLDYLSSILPPRVKRRLHARTDFYRPKELNDTLTPQEAEKWFRGPYDAYGRPRLRRRHRLTYDHLRQFSEIAHPRPGIVPVFQKLESLDIPRIISSGGNKDVIRLWHETHNAPVSDIVSTEFVINKKGRVKNWKKNTLIHTLNKHTRTNEVVARYADRPLTILFGDSLQDADIIEGDENVLRVRVKPDQINETAEEKQEYRRRTFEKFDLLLEEGNFMPFLNFLDELSRNTVNRFGSDHSQPAYEIFSA